jgi:hypothetical protein
MLLCCCSDRAWMHSERGVKKMEWSELPEMQAGWQEEEEWVLGAVW